MIGHEKCLGSTASLYKKEKTMLTIRMMVAAGVFAVSAIASATPLNNYNVLISGDFNATGSGHIEGKTFIGGNLQNGSVFAQSIDKNSTQDTLKVVGNINGNSSMHVEAGYVAYAGNLQNVPANQDWCNGNGINSNAACFHAVTDGSLAAEKTSLFSQLGSESAFYKGLAGSADTSVLGDMNNKKLVYSGAATDLVVFNLTQADFLSTNAWDLVFGNASRVVINVAGSSFNSNVGQSGNLASDQNASRVLWNFYDATTINFQREWYGNLLALNADITTNHNLTGSLAAKSYSGNAEIHDGYWDFTPPTKQVPEPSSGLLALLALAGLGVRRLFSK